MLASAVSGRTAVDAMRPPEPGRLYRNILTLRANQGRIKMLEPCFWVSGYVGQKAPGAALSLLEVRSGVSS